MDILVSPPIERLIRDSLDEDIGAGDLATMATISAESQGKGCSEPERWRCGGIGALGSNFLFYRSESGGAPSNQGWQPGEERQGCGGSGRSRSRAVACRTDGSELPPAFVRNGDLNTKYVDAVKDLPCKVLDTRKTTPGLRTLEKYAVRMGEERTIASAYTMPPW